MDRRRWGEKEGRPTIWWERLGSVVELRPIGLPTAAAQGLNFSEETDPLTWSVGWLDMVARAGSGLIAYPREEEQRPKGGHWLTAPSSISGHSASGLWKVVCVRVRARVGVPLFPLQVLVAMHLLIATYSCMQFSSRIRL